MSDPVANWQEHPTAQPRLSGGLMPASAALNRNFTLRTASHLRASLRTAQGHPATIAPAPPGPSTSITTMGPTCDLVAAIRWRKMNICSPPQRTGVYAVKHGRQWMYIGKAGNIAARITAKRHPIQITSGLDRYRFDYYWCPVPSDKLTRAENALIRTHNPEWNGGTSWEGNGGAVGPCCSDDHTVSQAEILAVLAGLWL